MAYNDSGELPVSQSTYSLGGYTFELKVQTVHEPGEPDVVSVYAICRGPDGNRETVPMDFPSGTTVESWTVEANETEASVYATVNNNIPVVSVQSVGYSGYYSGVYGPAQKIATFTGPGTAGQFGVIIASSEAGTLDSAYTYYGKTVYYHAVCGTFSNYLDPRFDTILNTDGWPSNAAYAAWYMIYGSAAGDNGEKLIARFAIDIREADTDGWDEPGDDGPPGTTLNVTVTGATAGSCTGTPADNETVKGYGDGGDGGYGGGGGAGASTVIIYEFATSLADSVSQEAISRGPGTGGHGGKGGKGGDGCILIFY